MAVVFPAITEALDTNESKLIATQLDVGNLGNVGFARLFSLRKAFWIFCRDGAFIGLLVGRKCAELIVGEEFSFTSG